MRPIRTRSCLSLRSASRRCLRIFLASCSNSKQTQRKPQSRQVSQRVISIQLNRKKRREEGRERTRLLGQHQRPRLNFFLVPRSSNLHRMLDVDGDRTVVGRDLGGLIGDVVVGFGGEERFVPPFNVRRSFSLYRTKSEPRGETLSQPASLEEAEGSEGTNQAGRERRRRGLLE
jgi:hypothetical protein